ncbi:MAG: polyprenyl synthetase family protein [Chthoniobacterales bacterium]
MTSRKAVRPQADGLSLYLERRRKLVEQALARAVPAASVRPATIHKAMRYSLLAGGKRLRPILALAAAEACGAKDPTGVLPAACAVELIHTYSLIHDDLPCMDDDDLRRGRPTSHKVFGEGVAVLAGDALLTRAFGLIAGIQPAKRYPLSLLLGETADAAGSLQLIAGQVADLEAEGKRLTIREVRFIHERKTAAMIVLPLRLGAMVANATPAQLKALTEFGQALGLAFQIQDDILDVTATSEQLGKSAGKDLKASKATYPAVIGLKASRKEAVKQTRAALRALYPLGARGERLRELSESLLKRQG